jgi:hypothetical protein
VWKRASVTVKLDGVMRCGAENGAGGLFVSQLSCIRILLSGRRDGESVRDRSCDFDMAASFSPHGNKIVS